MVTWMWKWIYVCLNGVIFACDHCGLRIDNVEINFVLMMTPWWCNWWKHVKWKSNGDMTLNKCINYTNTRMMAFGWLMTT